ncbi:MAG: SRPBCC domain-containing protein, partial [Acidimicrobiia bacterium]|nr:SRPBCC domain-containing protein [Acidimicrobiia bacterium]
MILQAFKKKKEISFERHYAAPVEDVWRAWTDADQLRRWWGPEKTSIPECEVDLRVGGSMRIVTEAGEEMGKYAGTRWPLVGTFTVVEPRSRLVYDARSWTEGEEEGSTIHHSNDLTLAPDG